MNVQRNIGCIAVSFGVLMPVPASCNARDFPYRPIRIVTSEAGGGNDFIARLIAPPLAGSLGQPVIVDNRAGVIPAQIVSRATADGHTLLLGTGTLWLLPLMQQVPYDAVQDFAPVTLAVKSPNVLVVHPALPVKSVSDLVNLAKAKPGVINYGSASTGSAVHLAAELFNVMAGVHIVRVPYKGSGPAITALIGGEVQIMFGTSASVAPHVKSGKLRAVAVTSAQPSALFPGLPTVAGSGLPGYESVVITGVLAPAKTPRDLVQRINLEIARLLGSAAFRDKLPAIGVEAVADSPEQFAATIKSEIRRMGKVIRDAGIRAE